MTNYLPKEVLQIIDLETISPQKDSYIEKELEETFSDLLFKTKIEEKEGYIYFLFEHKSYPSDKISIQLLKYIIKIWEQKINIERSEIIMTIAEKLVKEGMEKGIKKGMEKGMEKGKLQEKKEVARKLIAKGLDINSIAEITGLTETEIKEIIS